MTLIEVPTPCCLPRGSRQSRRVGEAVQLLQDWGCRRGHVEVYRALDDEEADGQGIGVGTGLP